MEQNDIALIALIETMFNRLRIRGYLDSEFFPDHLQTYIERCIGPQGFPMCSSRFKFQVGRSGGYGDFYTVSQ